MPSLFISERNIFGFGVSNGGSGGIKIRGVGGSPTNSVLMMVDGQPQFAGIYSHPIADFYGTEYVERVEVLPYHTLGVFKWEKLGISYPLEGIKPPTKERVENAERILGIRK